VALRDLKAYLRSTLEIDLDQLSLRGPGKGEKPVAAWSTDDIAAWLSSIGSADRALNFLNPVPDADAESGSARTS
jgi:hypothetical protein